MSIEFFYAEICFMNSNRRISFMQALDEPTFFDLFSKNTVILTPNNRLSAVLLEEFYALQGEKTLQKPHCLPLKSYLIQCFHDCLMQTNPEELPLLLNPSQLRTLWRNILEKNSPYILSQGLLQAVMDSWKNALQWQLSVEDAAFQLNPQYRQFQQWWKSFNDQLEKQQWITEIELPGFLIKQLYQPKNTAMIWVSFDEFTPTQQALQSHWQTLGIHQYNYQPEARQAHESFQYAASDEETELGQMIQWLKTELAAGKKKIAVVVPDLQEKKNSLQRKLDDALSPDVYNISLGEALTAYPLVTHAIHWLKLNKMKLSRHQATLLLSSPFIKGSREECHLRSEIQHNCALLREKENKTRQWISYLQTFAPRLAELLENLNDYPEQARIGQWLDLFLQRLEGIGFPGSQGLSSTSYQCLQSLKGCFESLRTLAVFGQSYTFSEAIALFEDICEQTIFQPQSTKKPIQVSGMLEASGIRFDSLWFMGLSDHCLPEKPRLSAFIPKTLQIEKNMPHSSAEKESLFAQKLMQGFQNASPLTIFSYAKMSADTPNMPSPLLNGLPQLMQEESQPAMPISALIPAEENYQVPILADERLRGGTGLLANQAKCPFKAFAAHRLKASPPQSASMGLDALERGEVSHKILEIIWRDLGSQKALLDCSKELLEEKIHQAIQTALFPIVQQEKNSFPSLVQRIEIQRLKHLALDSLALEKQRPPFVIDELEKAHEIDIQGLKLKVRIDRIDRLENDKKWLIDYKSSLPMSSPWDEERPREPQLLLYALLDDEINTLLFIQLKPGHVKSKSFGEEKLNLKHHKTAKEMSWKDYKKNWQQQLEQLADEIQTGHCRPDPINASICNLCEFQSLCRYST